MIDLPAACITMMEDPSMVLVVMMAFSKGFDRLDRPSRRCTMIGPTVSGLLNQNMSLGSRGDDIAPITAFRR